MIEYNTLHDEQDRGDRQGPGQGFFRDFRMALHRGTPYRINRITRSNRQVNFITAVICCGIVLLIIYYNKSRSPWYLKVRPYNSTYPLTPGISSDSDMKTFRIAIVSDLDTSSVSSDLKSWHSYLKKGYLSYSSSKNTVVVTWDTTPPLILSSSYALKGRGMELSELVVYDGRLLTFDDRSGIVYEIFEDKVIPWLLLIDGNGRSTKGFKSEWATVKDELLYVGSMGKEWTTPGGQFESYDPMFVKVINMNGEIRHENWVKNYKAIRSAIGVEWPGYMIHESGAWSSHSQRWMFLPRRCSFDSYNETKDEIKGCNYLITADADFTNIQTVKVGKPIPTHGFSSFKFLPGTNDEIIVALRSTEFQGSTATYILAFRITGEIVMEETLIDNMKYEGLEFI